MDKFPTDIDGVFADGTYKNATGDDYPMFNVGPDLYYKKTHTEDGQDWGRRRLPVDPDTDLGKYIQQAPTNSPIYLKYTDERGDDYIKKLK